MEAVFQILMLVLFLFGGIYVILITLFTIGWFRLKNFDENSVEPFVSVIIPARNEVSNIEKLLKDLKKQSVSNTEFEILIIDDHSEDETRSIVQNFAKQNPNLKIRILENSKEGKKEAIKTGIRKAKGDIILSTDADCRLKQNWISLMRNPFIDPAIKMVSAPVVYTNEKSFLAKIQSLDFLSLIVSAAGAIGIKLPFMCNGANLAFRKSTFEELNAFEENQQFASGDDVFLLHKIKKKYGAKSITFMKDRNAIIETVPVKSFKFLLRQRKRWASKSKGYKDLFTLFLAFIVAAFSFMLIVSAFISILNYYFSIYFGIALSLKILVDFVLLKSAANFFKRKSLLWIYLPVQLLYPFYTMLITLLAIFTKNEWKGRAIN